MQEASLFLPISDFHIKRLFDHPDDRIQFLRLEITRQADILMRARKGNMIIVG